MLSKTMHYNLNTHPARKMDNNSIHLFYYTTTFSSIDIYVYDPSIFSSDTYVFWLLRFSLRCHLGLLFFWDMTLSTPPEPLG